MGYGDFKDLSRRTVYDKVLRDKAFNIAKNPKYDRYQKGIASMVYKFFDKKTASSGKFNKGFRFLLCVDDIFSIYAWVVPSKDKIGITITNTFQKMLKESNRKPNKIWVDKGSESYISSFKEWLKDNDIEMYSIHNEENLLLLKDLLEL